MSDGLDKNYNQTIHIEKNTCHLSLINPPPTINDPTLSKILVVEYNVIAQTVAKTLLNAMSGSVELAPNGATAIDLFEKINLI